VEDKVGRDTRRVALICALLAAVTLATFWPVHRHQFLNYDDDQYVTANRHVESGLTWDNAVWAFNVGYASNWHPLTWLSHMLDAELFGVKSGPQHLVNLLFHTANAVLLFLLLRHLSAALWRSAMVAALFALHPLHVESVAWLAERKDVLSTFFFLLTLWAYARYVESAQRHDHAEKPGLQVARGLRSFTGRWYGLALLFFALGLMSKPMLVSVPFVLLLLDFWPLQRSRSTLPAGLNQVGASGEPVGASGASGSLGTPPSGGSGRQRRSLARWLSARFSEFKTPVLPLLFEKVPFLALAIASSVLTFVAQKKGHAVALWMPLSVRVANAIASVWKYLAKTFWPTNLAIFYPHPDLAVNLPHPAGSPPSFQWPAWLIMLAALLLVIVSVAVLRSRQRQPWLATGWFWYLVTLGPAIGIVQVGGQAMADRYTYIPSIGIFILVVWTASESLSGWRASGVLLRAASALVLGACVVLSHKQLHYWRNNSTLWEHALAITTCNYTAEIGLGLELLQEGKAEQSIALFEKAIAHAPFYPPGHFGLADALGKSGKNEEAVEEYKAGLRLDPSNAVGHDSFGLTLLRLGKADEALDQFDQAVFLAPDEPFAQNNLGLALSRKGKLDQAVLHFQAAVRLKPDYQDAVMHLAEALLKQGNLPLAQVWFNKLVQLRPADFQARVNLGVVLWRLGLRDQAEAQYTEALHLKPDDPAAHCALGDAFLAQDRLPEAAAQFAEARRLSPENSEALTGLGRALADQGKFAEAQGPFQEVVRLCPTNAMAQLNLANTLLMSGQTNPAQVAFHEASRLEPDLARKNLEAGVKLAAQGQLDAAVVRLRTALNLAPENPEAMVKLSWILATRPEPGARNGPEAVRLAERACQLNGGKDSRFWTTLAAAYAETGRLAEAVTSGEKALELAQAAGDQAAAGACQARLKTYRNALATSH